MQLPPHFFENSCKVDVCSITGASAFFLGIKDAVVIINGSKFCFLQMLHRLQKSFLKPVKNRIFCTNIKENGIIYGNEENIKKVLTHIMTELTPSVICLQNNCATSLIGDDLEGIISEFNFSCPVVIMDSGGIQGTFQDGFNKAALQFFSSIKIECHRNNNKNAINLLGASEAFYNYRYDIKEIKKLLALGHIEVLHYIPDEIDIDDLQNLTTSSLNVVLYPELGKKTAEFLKEKYNIPYLLLDLPYGLKGSYQWIVSIMRALKIEERRIVQVRSYFDNCRSRILLETSKLEEEHGSIWIDEVLLAGPLSVVSGLSKALGQEFLNYNTMKLFVHSMQDIGKSEETSYDTILSEFSVEKILNKNTTFLFGSLNEHAQILQRSTSGTIGYCCIAFPSNDYVSLGPYMGLGGIRNLLMCLWNYYISNLYSRVLKPL